MLKKLLKLFRQLLRKRPAPPEPYDPYAGVRVPIRKGPPNRSGAVALEEPED